MMYWSLERQEGGVDAYLGDEALTRAAHQHGIRPTTVRAVFTAARGHQPIIFQLAGGSSGELLRGQQGLTDLLFWSWVPIFSARAREMMIGLGCDSAEFWPCFFESNQGEDFSLHLPEPQYDVVDAGRSSFLMMIPGDPPIPHHIEKLVLQSRPHSLPNCFRAAIPGDGQVFGELLVSTEFKILWEQKRLSGARFRALS